MAASNKKVIVRLVAGDHLAGYLAATCFLQTNSTQSTLELLDLSGRALPIRVDAIKYIAFVRDFNLDDPANPERLTRSAFLSRPRAEGLWLRLTFPSGERLEGLAPADTTFLDALVADAGIFLTPPDDRTNTHRLYIPRSAIAQIQFVAVIATQSRAKSRSAQDESQPNLFPAL